MGPGGAGGTWSRVDTTMLIDGYAGRGITPGPDGYIYMAGEDGGENNSRVVRWLASDHAMGAIPATRVTRVIQPGLRAPAGLGFDRNGRMYLSHWGPGVPLVRYDPTTMMSTTHAGPNQNYSYSDFTGSVRRASIPQGSYEQTFDLGCANPVLSTFEVAGSFPAGTTTNVSMRTAATVAGLATATPVPVASIPPLASPYNMATAFSTAGVAPSAQLRVTMSLRAGSDGAVPSVSRINLVWTCP
jgi:hypothetical protein